MFLQQEWLQLNAKHIVSCCRKVSGEINGRHDTVVNILLNNILVQRGLITHEQKWEDRKIVRTARDEITIGTEHWRSDERREKGRVAGAKLKPDLVLLRRGNGGPWKKVVVDVKVTSTDRMNEAFKKMINTGNDHTGNTGEEGLHGCDSPSHRFPRRGCPQRHGDEMEELRPGHPGRLGADGSKRTSL